MLFGGFARCSEGLHCLHVVRRVYMLLGGFTCC